MHVNNHTMLIGSIAVALTIPLAAGTRIPVFADAGAIGSAMGGIQFGKESRISMEKERLTISKWKVTAEYEFLNNTDNDITIAVAFPVPDATCNSGYALGKESILNSSVSFHVWADGKELHYSTEAKAVDRDGHGDFTDFVKGVGADIVACSIPATLSREDGQRLVASRLAYYVLDDPAAAVIPQWTIREKYYWLERFPAHRTVVLKNEYKPFPGWLTLYVGKEFPAGVDDDSWSGLSLAERTDSCLGPQIIRKFVGLGDRMNFSFVKYVLMTANTWNGPIKNFELIVEKPPGISVSFCWDGPVERLDKTHFRAAARNFTPKRNLEVGFSYPR
jgi:hypothetical protein